MAIIVICLIHRMNMINMITREFEDQEALGQALKEAIAAGLKLSPRADFRVQNPLDIGSIRFVPDVVVRDGRQTYIIQIRNTPGQEDMSVLALIRSMHPEAFEKFRFVLAAKAIPNSIEVLAERLGVKVVQLPYSLPIESLKDDSGRITSEKAWKIVVELLQQQTPSIRSMGKRTGSSYGWAHKVVSRLISRGIAERRAGFIRLKDAGRLLDVIAMERPIGDLEIGTVQTAFKESHDAATAWTKMLGNEDVGFAFTAHTAATIYTGYAARHDSVYLYVEDRQLFRKLKMNEHKASSGRVTAHVYLEPHRDVFGESKRIRDVMVVSKAQALMDIAGFGMSARAVASDMVKRYAAI